MTQTPEFDYELQVWTISGIVQRCGHPAAMREQRACCNASTFHGLPIEAARIIWFALDASGKSMAERA